MEHGYKLEDKTGNGVIYDTHIYPMKPEYNPVEKAVECLVDEAPILVGEYGHWGERLFDWYDNYLCEYPHVWMNEIHDLLTVMNLTIRHGLFTRVQIQICLWTMTHLHHQIIRVYI